MTVCKKCNGTGEINVPVTEHLGTVLYGTEQCDECDGMGEVQTNEEWFCQLPTGEKAEFFANIYPKSVGEALIKISNGDKERWVEWLKEKHE